MARLYLTVMAYPERGARIQGRQGDVFFCALFDWAIWKYRKQYGRKDAVSRFPNIEGNVPKGRQFQSVLNRGLARINIRMQVLELLLQRIDASVSNDFNDKILNNPNKNIPHWGVVLNSDIEKWSKFLIVNKTGIGRNDVKCKSKDLKRRTIYPSVPVLHMARGIMKAVESSRDSECFVKGMNVYLSLLMCSELWIYDALAAAQEFQMLGAGSGFLGELTPSSMVHLSWNSA